jgi:hypothetical protein
MTSHHLHNTTCPKCKQEGKDNGNDNLAVYSDGHVWCWSCGYYASGSRTKAFSIRNQQPKESIRPQQHSIRLPSDCDTGIPRQAIRWIENYALTKNTLMKHNVLWSESWQRLIFPYYIEGNLEAWQGRYFGTEKDVKWFSQGKLNDIIYTLGEKSNSLVLVEDIVSAIKVSAIKQCSPIFGSVISNNRLLRLKNFYDTLYIWLDPDKRKESLQFANKARLFGFTCYTIFSDKDPKETSMEEITTCLTKS